MVNRTTRWWLGAFLVGGAMLAGCGEGAPAAATPDTGTPFSDTGPDDAAGGDGGGSDSGVTDTGTPVDTGGGDVTAGDTGTPVDTGTSDDGGALDAGADSGTVDAGLDAGVVDAGGTDAGMPVDVMIGLDACSGELCPRDLRPHRGASLVGAGGTMQSPNFRMVSTLGQSSIHQRVVRSTNFRLRGGLVGATGGR
ncbi:MAG: hypothetical protein JNK72_05705 [Myxococcales bacterium]|nr:hypothetical protein [Myxococcales bacterium]